MVVVENDVSPLKDLFPKRVLAAMEKLRLMNDCDGLLWARVAREIDGGDWSGSWETFPLPSVNCIVLPDLERALPLLWEC